MIEFWPAVLSNGVIWSADNLLLLFASIDSQKFIKFTAESSVGNIFNINTTQFQATEYLNKLKMETSKTTEWS